MVKSSIKSMGLMCFGIIVTTISIMFVPHIKSHLVLILAIPISIGVIFSVIGLFAFIDDIKRGN